MPLAELVVLEGGTTEAPAVDVVADPLVVLELAVDVAADPLVALAVGTAEVEPGDPPPQPASAEMDNVNETIRRVGVYMKTSSSCNKFQSVGSDA